VRTLTIDAGKVRKQKRAIGRKALTVGRRASNLSWHDRAPGEIA